jgi:uncharacterized protein YeaO (DUF488 family)
VKGKANLAFAPSWSMVQNHKSGEYSDEQYTSLYQTLMNWSQKKYPEAWQDLLRRDEVTIVCFCAPGKFCHRYILKDILVNLGATYMGEREIPAKSLSSGVDIKNMK